MLPHGVFAIDGVSAIIWVMPIEPFGCFYGFQNEVLHMRFFHARQLWKLCFLSIFIDFGHGFCPEMIAKATNLLLKRTERLFVFLCECSHKALKKIQLL